MSNILVQVFKLVWAQVLTALLSIILIVLLPVKNIYSVFFAVLTIQYLYLIFTRKPSFKSWVFTLFFTLIFFLTFWALSLVLGFFGAVGVMITPIVILLFLAGWKIWENWRLYDAVTTWGAERIRGKHKESFNLDEVLKK